MRTRKKQKVIIGTLCVVIIGMVVGYATMSQLLNINGTSNIVNNFDIQFSKIEFDDANALDATNVSTSGIGTTTATFKVDLKKPGSSATYNVTVENKGTIDATLKSIEGLDESNAKAPTDIKFSIENITLNENLLAKQSKTFQVKVEWLISSSTIPETSKTLNLKLNYEQKAEIVYEPKSINEQTNELLDSSTTYNYMDGRYLSGAQDSNYVWFDGFMWRIMGINKDGSVRMITEENVTAIPWKEIYAESSYDTSYINDWLNNYFYPKLKDKNLLVNATWCSEKVKESGSAQTTCANNLSTQSKPVGLLSLDEFNLANAASSYLNNRQTYFFSTLNGYASASVWYANRGGYPNTNDTNKAYGVRPVIMISSDATIIGGNGSITDPYMIEDKTINITGPLNSNSYVGEYVTYSGRNYRVVETNESGTKLILDGYYDANNDGIIEELDKLPYNSDETGWECMLCTTINEETFVNWITNNDTLDAMKLVSTTWYSGSYFGQFSGVHDYKENLSNTENPYEGRVGLIRVGEMLSGQSETILSKNHTVANNISNAVSYWTSTQNNPFMTSPFYQPTNSWYVNDEGYGFTSGVSTTFGVRPVIMISPSVTITSGEGTPNSPYQI